MAEYLEIGRTFDSCGIALHGTGVTLDRESPTAKLLMLQPAVIISNPVTKEYGAKITLSMADNSVMVKGLGIIPPGSIGPPKHIHPNYAEEFNVVEGAFYFTIGKKECLVNAGETVIVSPGTPHTFRPADSSKVNSFLVAADPPGKLEEVIRTLWALAHEGKTNKKGQPVTFWQGLAIGYALREDTLFVSPPPFIQRIMFSLFGDLALQKGFKGVYPEYSSDEFWIKRVEQIRF